MVSALLLAAAAVCALLGMALLALAMKPHSEQVCGVVPEGHAAPRKRRGAGGLALLGAFVACLAADHASMAVLVWILLSSAAALTVAMTLAYRPGWLGWLARLTA